MTTTIQRRAMSPTGPPISVPPDAQTTRPGHERDAAQGSAAGAGTDSPQATSCSTTKAASPAGPNFDSGQRCPDAQATAAAVEPLSSSGHRYNGTHVPDAAAGPPLPADHSVPDVHVCYVGGDQTGNGSDATIVASTPRTPPSLSDPFLALAADVLDDAERTRIANENRLRQLTRTEADSDGHERGFGLDESHPDVARLAALVEMLRKIEHQAGLNLNRLLRQHPLGPWIKAQKGIGEKQAARLLAVVGDPYINEQTGQPRTVSQLWAYCGHGDPARRKFKGMTQADLFTLGNPVAKSRVWLISCAVLKAQGPLSVAYYDRKAATEGRLHAAACVRCGPSGHPALEGSPWSDAHRHADALRITGKTILRDLWLEARRIHEGESA